MMRTLRFMLLGSLVTMAGCGGCDNDRPDFCKDCYDTDAEIDTDADTDTDTNTDTDTDTDSETDPPFDGFSEPGDYALIDVIDEEDVEIDLTDIDGDSNKGQEFYAIFVNAAEGSAGYTIDYSQSSRGGEPQPQAAAGSNAEPAQAAPTISPYRQELQRWIAERAEQGVTASPPPPMPDLAVGDTQEFTVRDDLGNESSYEPTTGTLVALGDTVAIWVDNAIGLDWDDECDDNPEVIDDNPSWGFNNCDLETIAGIVDSNIMVNLEALLGEFSDVNGDDRVTVLVTPVLNHLPQTSEDPDEHAAVFESYADPEVDLNEYDVESNPDTDYQEIIYVFAPDPYGYHNSDFTTTVEAYTSMSLAAQIAAQTSHLIIYNNKVLDQAGADESSWLRLGIGAVAADLCGFGAIYFDDAWDYLDAPHLYGLTTESEEGVLSLEGRGAQYLFLRWLVDVYGTEILAELVQSSETGTDNVLQAVMNLGGPDSFNDLIVEWQVAMLTSGVTNVDGDPLMEEGTWHPYAEAEFIEAPTEPPETPTVGTHYGANGYQRGLNFNGTNVYMENGTTADPTENESQRITLGNSDHSTYVQGFEFYGAMEAGYAASIVRLTDIPYDETTMVLGHPGSDFLGTVIRWNDPLFTDYAVEESYSSSVTTSIALPSLPDDGTPIYGVGDIGIPWDIVSYNPDGEYGEGSFYDSDRWLLDLSDRALGSQVRVHIWLDRRYESTDGDIVPFDPWMALVPTEWVPTPNETDTTRDRCMSGGAIDFAYPTSVLDFLYYQEIITHEPIASTSIDDPEEEEEEGGDDGGSTGFDACGQPPEDTGIELSCINDWDSDGVQDADEPTPSTFYEQVLVRMCSIDPDLLEQDLWGPTWFDADTLDEDENPTRDRINNTGGAAGDSGEEAFLDLTLEGGSSYLLVVSGGTDEGAYELTLREIPG
jgi:hypothetical protein